MARQGEGSLLPNHSQGVSKTKGATIAPKGSPSGGVCLTELGTALDISGNAQSVGYQSISATGDLQPVVSSPLASDEAERSLAAIGPVRLSSGPKSSSVGGSVTLEMT